VDNGDPDIADQLPSHDEKAEWSLLACLVEKPSVIPAIDPDTLYLVLAKDSYKAMRSAWETRITDEPVTLSHHLCKALPQAAYLQLDKALDELPSAESWTYWHGIVMDCYKARCLEQLKPQITAVSQQVARGGKPDEVLFEIQKIAKLWHGSKSKTTAELMPEVQEYLEHAKTHEGKYPGEITGFHNLDRLLCGLQKGKHYVIGGRPGHGKSSLISCMAVGLARRDVTVGVISLEMLGVEIVGRMVSAESRVPIVRFTRGAATDQEVWMAAQMMGQINALPITIADKLRTLPEIIMAMHEQAAKGVKVIFVDYLQKILVPKFRGNRNELVTEISGTMKEMSMSLEIPIVSCAQLNRESEKGDREPTMADLRDSGAIEQDADFVGLLHTKGKGPDPDLDGGEATDIIVGKNRSGETTRLSMAFRKEIFRFDEV
jgi:replicative DNA helicase